MCRPSSVLSELGERDLSQNLTVGVCHVEHPACPIRCPALDHPRHHISCRDAGGFGVCQLRSAIIGNGFVGTPAMEEVTWHNLAPQRSLSLFILPLRAVAQARATSYEPMYGFQ